MDLSYEVCSSPPWCSTFQEKLFWTRLTLHHSRKTFLHLMRSVIQRNCFDVGRFCKESALNVLFKKWMFLPNIYWLPAMPKHPLKPGSKNAPKAEKANHHGSPLSRASDTYHWSTVDPKKYSYARLSKRWISSAIFYRSGSRCQEAHFLGVIVKAITNLTFLHSNVLVIICL